MDYEAAFEYLDDLRESGATNMFGARPYVQERFNCTRSEAAAMLSAWMQSFDPDKTPAERAAHFATVNA